MPELINPRSERVRSVRALSGRSARLRTGRFLVEGPQSVREAVRYAPDLVRDLFLTETAADRYTEIVGAAHEAGVTLRSGSDEVLDAMSPDAQGVVAVLDRPQASLEDVAALNPRLVAVLLNVRDPGNAGTVIRAADAAGADAVLLAGESVDVLNPKVVRSTAGSLFHLPVVAGASYDDVLGAVHGLGMAVLAADGVGPHDLDDLLDVAGAPGAGQPDLAAPTAWVFGNEAWGLRPEDRDRADAVVRVPIRGRAESLNLATAATVCLYGSARAQR